MKNILTQDQKNNIDVICRKYGIVEYTINPDGSIDVNGDVQLTSQKLDKLPLNFNKVTGDLTCTANNLTSFEGFPTSVGGGLYLSRNKLTSLEGCPTDIGEDFYVGFNQLTSLIGSPKVVQDFVCTHNNLTSLEHCPNFTGSYYSFIGNKFPPEVATLLVDMQGNENNINTFIKYQDHFDVWTGPEGFNEQGFSDLMAEIDEGLE